jgi:tetratricopeptide (TPR) repeat protein
VELTPYSHIPAAKTIQLERDLRIAIAEFAPSSQVIAKGYIWESAGLRVIRERTWPVYWYSICPACKRFHIQKATIEENPPTVLCNSCQMDIGRREVHRLITPIFGFVTNRENEPQKPGESRPKREFTTRPYFFWIKARIKADPEEVINSINFLRKDKESKHELENIRQRSDAALSEIKKIKNELNGTKKNQAIIAQYNEAIKKITITNWFEKGYAASISGNYNEAISAYDKAIELNPNEPYSYYVGFAVLEFHRGELAAQDLHEIVAAPACRLKETGVDPLGLAFHEVKHGLDHPRGGEDLAVIGDSLFRPYLFFHRFVIRLVFVYWKSSIFPFYIIFCF